MKIYKTLFSILIAVTFVVACENNIVMKENKKILPPKAQKISHQHKAHGDIRVDNYYWLNERNNPEVVDYLERENDYYDKMTLKSNNLQKELYKEMRSRIKEDDNSVPYFYNGYWYITRYETNKSYPIYTRKKDSLNAKEEILADVNEMARGYEYFRFVGLNISPDNKKMAYAIDTQSRRKYTIYVKDLNSNELLKTKILTTTGSSVWANNNQHLFYTSKDDKTLRSYKVFKHDIKSPNNDDKLVYHEKDETFSVYVSKSKSKKYLFISSYSTLTSEHRFLDADIPLETFKLVQKRIKGVEYEVSHHGDSFYIITNHGGANNYKVVKTSINKPTIDNWTSVIDHREDVLLEDIDLYKDFWVITERSRGLNRIKINSWEGDEYYLPVSGETYSLYNNFNPEFNTSKLRFSYSSLIHPRSVKEFDIITNETKLLKSEIILDEDFKSSDYIEKRIWTATNDSIPISLVYHKNTKLNSNTPLLLYAYGSYGSTIDPYFSNTRLSLLKRGFVYAIAHVRGGEYLGRSWYEDGKLLNKKNTFNDFINCSKYLISKGYTSSNHLYAYGGSAGGLLIGVIINEEPNLYKGVISAVPFVDVITTMLDKAIPLTTSEYDEWGDPNIKKYYDYILSYSPYDQIKKQNYPNILVTSGFHDSQVQYWEPAKWVAKLRDFKTDKNIIFLNTDMNSGHGGPSGRFESLKETAKKYAFLIQLEMEEY
ncbi:MAG: oligopeptidase B [Flavobacteriaceae bacterium]|nr:oligopeptidase B [Flavobacteriaceae bacterium]